MFHSDDSCRPSSGKTYLTIGQDLFSIQEYVSSEYNFSLHDGKTSSISDFSPAAAMVYTSLDSIQNGTSLPTDYGTGVEYADGILNSLFHNQGVGLQIGLWLDGYNGCEKINNGAMDENIQILIKYLESCTASKVFLRIGYEFDNPWFGFEPSSYVRAFQTIVTACHKNLSSTAKSKVKFVWHSWAAPRSDGVELVDFYPGDEYVDWIGVSIFQQLYPWKTEWGGDHNTVEEVLDFAISHNKPTMIAER